ncbi:MAG: MFS transporter [Candidatus Dormibacteria bacterium]
MAEDETMGQQVAATPIRYGTTRARWVLAATVLGSGMAFLDSTVVNVALPALGRDLHTGVAGLQWMIDAYLVALSALLLLGGSLGDLFGRRRVFVIGLVVFTIASLLCGLAPSIAALIAARAVQGAGAALLVPGSLAMISASFHPEDRSRAIGAWSGLAAVSGAIGPFAGGWLIDNVSWRLIFLINLPLAAAAVWIAAFHVPESRDEQAGRPDALGAVAAAVGLAGVAYALIEAPSGLHAPVIGAGLLGVGSLIVLLRIERRSSHPMLPLELFTSRQFNGANVTTLAVYAGLGGALFLVVLQLQLSLGYSALQAATSMLPITGLLLLLSSGAGRLAQRTGPRLPMTVGPLVAAAGLVLLSRIQAGVTYGGTVLPAVLVFGLGLTLTVAPLTSAVLAAVDEHHLGVGSAVNNAAARLAGLVAVAVLPGIAGIQTGARAEDSLRHGFPLAMGISAALCAAGGVVAALTIRSAVTVRSAPPAGLLQPCQDACRCYRS